MLEDVPAIIDYVCARYRRPVTDQVARQLILGWLQQAENELAVFAPWTFCEIETNLFVPVGGSTGTSNGVVATKLRNAEGVPLTFVPLRTFEENYIHDVHAGYPNVWSMKPRTTAGDPTTLFWWPLSNANYTFKLTERVGGNALSDEPGVQSVFLLADRMPVALRTLELMAEQDAKPDLFQIFNAERQESIKSVVANDMSRRGGTFL